MARSINLYSRLFNRDENVHYCFSDKQKYFEAIAPYVLMSVPFGTWRINKGQLIVSESAFDAKGVDWQSVCYIADWPEVTSKAEFYYVTRKYEQSGYIVFLIEKDIWATNYPKANLSEIRISRCNRAVGNGVYDEIKEAEGAKKLYFKKTIDSIANYSVLVLASVVLQTGWFGSNPLTETILFNLPLSDFPEKVANEYSNRHIVEKVKWLVGGLKEVSGTPTNNHMQVLRCWIVPNDLVERASYGLETMEGNSFFAGGSYRFNNVQVALSGRKQIAFELADFTSGGTMDVEDAFRTSRLTFGPMGHEINLTRFTEDRKIYVTCYTGSAGPEILIRQGVNENDITEAFELNLNINNQVGTSAQLMKKTLTKLTTIIGSAVVGYKKGGAVGAGVGALASLMAVNESSGASSPASANGDGASVYENNLSAGQTARLTYPWFLNAYRSISDEAENAYVNGANFNIYNDDLKAIQSLDHLGARAVADDSTFIKAESLCVDGVDLQTSDFIKQEFMRGIRYKCL